MIQTWSPLLNLHLADKPNEKDWSYSGGWSEKNYKNYLASLQEWIEQNNLTVAGEPVWARYNAPFTPWFMRRNEILIALTP